MARPDTLIDEFRDKVRRLAEAFDGLAGVRRRYVALGGADFLRPYFLDSAGQPRTDLDLSADDIPNALASLEAVEALLAQGHMSNLARIVR
jgi:hypothetical protein